MLLRPATSTFRTRPQRCLVGGILLLRPRFFQSPVVQPVWWSTYRRSYSDTTTTSADAENALKKKSDPLHILFCGSDEFSCAALSALHGEHVRNPELVRSIDVVVRPGKPTGRGMKTIRHPPIRSLATELSLPIHERPTFTGWDMPPQINLITAVSFGLFVPPRLLRTAKYGGLNVHPSLLPDLRGPAPLQHTLLAARTTTGVSLQTLDEHAFDHGTVLAQTPALPVPETCTLAQLHALVTPAGAELLVSGLRDGVHVPPRVDRGWWRPEGDGEAVEEGRGLRHAPRITKADMQVLVADIPNLARRQRALGSQWFWSRNTRGEKRRVLIEGVTDSPTPPAGAKSVSIPFFEEEPKDGDGGDDGGTSSLILWWTEHDPDVFYTQGDTRIETLKVEGDKAKPARQALRNFVVDPRGVLTSQ
ncbi:formyl transferase [Whalleya microplaca]|nr:formyl transferase [Whalleya microplaca]